MRTRERIAMAAVLVLAAVAGGCQAMAWGATTFTPPKRIAAQYHLPPGKKVLVFVDDPSGAIADHGVQEKLAGYLEKELVARKLVGSLVPQSELQATLVSLGDDGNVHIPRIVRGVGADLVVYVQIEGLALTDDDTRTWQGKMILGTKVQDAQGRKLWPDAGQHRVPTIEYRPKKAIDDEIACKDHITDQMAQIAADRIAKLFYAHSDRELGEREVGRQIQP
jgi:hypothetical protein